ncbi:MULTISPECIES: hypothetical protein [unclassified Bradyrhizobium]|uniref:hypothetical protein n=1 Tax=unclassified Bradyrhizobium TaxID=2631580 RepID=UPI0012EB34F0|nr:MULTISPECIES: hypothetical protein [unclassified Bradyrhizobium]MCP3466584.1 hypothetical protein [Bradyrhizobium sp. CCGUVB23]
MIRVIAVCTVCVVGVVSPLGPSRAPAPDTDVGMASDFPAVSGNKSDRLPIRAEAIAPKAAVEADKPAVPTPQIAVAAPAVEPKTDQTQPRFISRHWHDPTASKYTIQKRSAADAKRSQTPSVEKPKQATEVKNCSSDGLAPLLRQLNLQPPCD